MKNEVATRETVLMAIQHKSMGSVGGTKAVGYNNGGYDGDGTSRMHRGYGETIATASRLWRNIEKNV